MPLWHLMRHCHFLKKHWCLLWRLVGLVVCWMDAWLGLSLCVGMPGWRLARLATVPFSKKCKHEFMRKLNIFQTKWAFEYLYCFSNIHFYYRFHVYFVFTKCIFLYILRSGWRVYIIILCFANPYARCRTDARTLSRWCQSSDERGGLIPCPH